MERVQSVAGMKLVKPDGAFYALPDVSAFFGQGVSARDFGPIPDADALCRSARCFQDCHQPSRVCIERLPYLQVVSVDKF